VRVSADKKSPHYHRWALVTLYSRPEVFALEADDVEGWVDVVDIAAACAACERGEKLKEWPRKRLRGHVEILLAP
jgi:hypothetical protein